MSLPFGLLGLLTYQDNTGYELTKMFENSLNNFWHAQSSQIYRELNRLEEKGWVTSKNVVQDKRPNKRVYSITQEGREKLAEWLRECRPAFENPHEPFLIRLFFGAKTPEVTLALLKACRDMCHAYMEERYTNIQKVIDDYASLIPGGETERLYWQMTLDFGITQTRATAEWAEECIKKLESIKLERELNK